MAQDISLVFYPARRDSLQQTDITSPTSFTPASKSNTTSTAPSIEKDFEDMDTQQLEWKPQTIELVIMITMTICSLLVALDSGILITVLPTLVRDLHGTTALAYWTGTSYLLAHAVLQPTISSLSDIFGRRELLIPSLLAFTAGSIVCAIAHNFTTMLTGRVVQGCGGAGIIALSQLVYADIVPLRQRPKYFAMVLAAWAVGSLTGALFGGLFVEHAHNWRWCFYINLPICGIALPLSLCLGRLTQPRTDLTTKLAAVDWSGNILFVASITSLLIGISWAGISYSWSSHQVLVPMIVGVVGIIATILFEMKISKTPFLRKEIFNSSSAIASYLCAALHGMALYMAYYFVTFYFSAAFFFGPTRSGLSLIPATATILPGSAITNILVTRNGHYRVFVWAGFVLSTISASCMILFNEHTSTPVWAAIMCFFGTGMGMLISAVNVSIQASVEPKYTGQAAVMYAFFRSLGMAVGVSISGTVFQNEMRRKLEALGVKGATELARNAEGFVESLMHMQGTEKMNILAGYVRGFHGVFVTMTGLCAAGLVVSLFVRQGNLNQKLNSRFSVQMGKTTTEA